MRGRLHRGRRVVAGALALLVSTTVLGSGIGNAEPSQDPESLTFADGTWTMLLVYNGVLQYPSFSAVATGDGGGMFTVKDEVASGSFNFGVATDVHAAGQGGHFLDERVL